MRNLNTNFTKVDDLQNMMASGRKFGHISDDPTALIYSQAARNKLARLAHYQMSVGTADKWLTQAEAGVMELQQVIANAYEACVDASTDVKGDNDRRNIGALIGQLRDHFVDTLNAAFGDKFIFGGYNTPGEPSSAITSNEIKPFTVENGKLYYNGFDLSQFDRIPAKLITVDLSGLDDVSAMAALQDIVASNSLDITGYDLDEVLKMHRLRNDVLSFDVGPGINMPVTMNGIDLVLFTTTDENGNAITRNTFEVLQELFVEANKDNSYASDLIKMIQPLQDAQNHLLTKTAEIGGRSRRLELLDARYEQDYINYETMKSDAEDADMAEVIMRLRMAEAVMQASMSAGARIIQPTLMDFLR